MLRKLALASVIILLIISASCRLFDTTPPTGPQFSPSDAVLYNEAILVEITGEEDALIFYTVDGTEPDTRSIEYISPVSISESTTLKARCVDAAGNMSPVTTAEYIIDTEPPAAPEFSLSDRTAYYDAIEVELTSDEDADIYYTLDGSEPSASDNLYTATIELDDDASVKALCIDTAGNPSEISTGEYIIYTPSNNVPYMDVSDGVIYNMSRIFEYSLDDGITWTDCDGSSIDVAFEIGDQVWVRDKADHDISYYLGEVEVLSGADLMPLYSYVGSGGFSDQDYGSVGEDMTLKTDIRNIGDQAISQSGVDFAFYLSEDRVIEPAEDVLLSTGDEYISIDPDETVNPYGSNYRYFTVPDVTSGTYYIGCVVDVNSEVGECTHGNNVTAPQHVEEFRVLDSTAVPSGAIKIVNSWGVGFLGENLADGHYWVTYDSAKSLNMAVRYYYNDFSHVYEPTILAVFDVDHPVRGECLLTLGLGDPDYPVIEKSFDSRWGTTSYAGTEPFPDNAMVLDISEFAPYINSHDLYLRADTAESLSGGTLNSLSVEFYNDYDVSPMKTIAGSTGTIPAGGTADFSVSTEGALSAFEQEAILPVSRSTVGNTRFIEETPGAAELQRDMDILGVYEPGKNYNIIVDGRFGTGDVPPTEEQWLDMKKLRGLETFRNYGDLPEEVDLSATKYFPPVGNQGGEGSCTAFSFGYYIQTYTEAREHDWDLSGTAWGGDWPGQPLSNRDKIISPDFLYHQINGGEPGSSGSMAATFIARLGGCSWEAMPYSDDDDDNGTYPWPDEAAFREAPLYRGREVSPNYWDYITTGYFILETDEDINLMKELLAAGYCLSTSVEAPTLYDVFDSRDVVSGYTGGPMSTNHANTIVGYKEGSAWDPSHPDD